MSDIIITTFNDLNKDDWNIYNMIKNNFITFRLDYISRQGYYILRKRDYILRW